jgi:hypothetical protein
MCLKEHFHRKLDPEGFDLINSTSHGCIQNLNRLVGGGVLMESGVYLDETGQ